MRRRFPEPDISYRSMPDPSPTQNQLEVPKEVDEKALKDFLELLSGMDRETVARKVKIPQDDSGRLVALAERLGRGSIFRE